MKATLEFDLPIEGPEFRWAIDGPKYLSLLEDIAQALRNKTKIDEEPPSSWHEVKDLFWQLVNESGVELA